MKLTEKYKEVSNSLIKLSSGGLSFTYYNFRKLLLKENRKDLFKIVNIFLDYIDGKYYNSPIVVGIHKMGGVIARFYFPDGNDRFCVYNPHTDTFLVNPKFRPIIKNFDNNYILIDDVITTGNTILKAMKNINKKPLEILCLKNRSKLLKIKEVNIYQLIE